MVTGCHTKSSLIKLGPIREDNNPQRHSLSKPNIAGFSPDISPDTIPCELFARQMQQWIIVVAKHLRMGALVVVSQLRYDLTEQLIKKIRTKVKKS